jgi:hypothetical protein
MQKRKWKSLPFFPFTHLKTFTIIHLLNYPSQISLYFFIQNNVYLFDF